MARAPAGLHHVAIASQRVIDAGSHKLAAITVLMAVWWMTEALPVAVTALLPLILFPALGIATPKLVAPNYGHDLIWLFLADFSLPLQLNVGGSTNAWPFMVRTCGTRADRLILGFMLASGLLDVASQHVDDSHLLPVYGRRHGFRFTTIQQGTHVGCCLRGKRWWYGNLPRYRTKWRFSRSGGKQWY